METIPIKQNKVFEPPDLINHLEQFDMIFDHTYKLKLTVSNMNYIKFLSLELLGGLGSKTD